MRVAIVCANYVQGKSYQENIWAEQLAKMGHRVRMFHVGDRDGAVQVVKDSAHAYEAQAAQTRTLPRSTFKSKTVARLVREFRPELIVVCGDKTFAAPVARDQAMAGVPLISTYSENLTMHEFDWRKRGITLKQRAWALGFLLVRGGPIRLLCRRSAVVVGNTPQARPILQRLFSAREWPRIDAKMIDMPLGFSPDHFGYDPQVRRRVRAELNVKDSDVLVCATSHFAPVKEESIRVIVDALARVMTQHQVVKAVIVGFSEKEAQHAAVSQRIGAKIDRTQMAIRFIRHPFAGRQRLNELYNASDIAVFNRASISCQEALGTGLIGCFVNDGSLNHLITMADQGVFFAPGDPADLAEKLTVAVERLETMNAVDRNDFRQALADGSRWLGYDRIIAAILHKAGFTEQFHPG